MFNFSIICHVFQTKELDNFKNLTEKASHLSVSEMTTVNYITSPDCTITCVSIGGKEIESYDLIKELAHNISTTAFPKISEIVEFLQSQIINSTATDVNNTDFSKYLNFSADYNGTYRNDSVLNDTLSIMESLNITDLTYSFVDYLTFILHSLVDLNQTLLVDDLNELSNYVSTTEISTTDLSTTGVSATENYELFKSTIAPIIVKTLKTTEIPDINRFDYDLDYTYNEITSTISTLKENCTKRCENVLIPIYKNVTSLAVYDLDQNMNYTMKARLRALCWETMFGQELVRLTVMDLVLTIATTLALEFFRGIFVRVMNR